MTGPRIKHQELSSETTCNIVRIEYTEYTLWLFNIAMENGSFIDGLAIKNGDFPWLCNK